MRPHVRYVIENVNMGSEHSGLAQIIGKELDIDLMSLPDSEVVLLLNASHTACKVIGCGGAVIGYLRMPQGGKLRISAIKYISETMGGGGFQFTESLRSKLAQILGDKSGNLKTAS